MFADVLIAPDMVVAVNETLPMALIPNVPPHVMAKLNVFLFAVVANTNPAISGTAEASFHPWVSRIRLRSVAWLEVCNRR